MNVHNVYIWDPQGLGLPATFDAAVEMALRLQETPDTPSDKMLTFAGKIEAYAAEYADDEEIGECLGGFVDQVKTFGMAAFRVELPEEGWERILRVLVETANNRGLLVVDAEGMMAFFPHGKVLPPSRAEVWQDFIRELDTEEKVVAEEENLPKTLKKYIKWSAQFFDKAMAEIGFDIKGETPKEGIFGGDPAYIRKTDAGDQYIIMDSAGSYPFFGFNFSFAMISDHVSSIYNRFEFYKTPYIFYLALNQVYDFSNHEQIAVGRRALLRDFDLIRNIALVFDGCVDVRGLNTVLNGGGKISELVQNSAFAPHCIIVAKLANDENFLCLAEKIAAGTWWGVNAKHKQVELPKLLNFLSMSCVSCPRPGTDTPS